LSNVAYVTEWMNK